MWNLVEYNEDYTIFNIDFGDNIESIASLTDEVSLRVTFWGVDLFKSSTDSVVRFGTELHWRVYRQISAEEQSTVE